MRPCLMAFVLVVSGVSHAADRKVVSTREQLARMEKELAAQRELMVRILELQNQCTTQMINAVKGLEVVVPTIAEQGTSSGTSSVVVGPPGGTGTGTGTTPPPPPPPPPHGSTKPKTAELSGRVTVSGGGPAWVFVEDVKGPGGSPVEIKQEDKQFNPRVVAVPVGTKLTFPNLDVVFHNVFSLSPGNVFDLGMKRAGDAVPSRVMTQQGVVEVFCNLHSRMSATILVTPGPLLARVGQDGTYRLPNVPVGKHRVSAWAGGQTLSTQQEVDVGPTGGTADFKVAGMTERAHTNKDGQAYGSYDD